MTRAEKAAASIASAYGTRPGTGERTAPSTLPPTSRAAEGLELSDIIEKPRAWFRFNPENEVFRPLKSEGYFRDLERDIREAGAILNPLIAMQDGTLIEGESRLLMAERIGMERLPVRVVLSPMTADEQRRRLWLGNLSRFEVDADTRSLLYARLWPGYFAGDKSAPKPKLAEVAEAMGVSERQVKREKAIVKEAIAEASEAGREATPEDVRKVREKKNGERREKAATLSADEVILRMRQVIDRLSEWAENEPVTFGAPSVKSAYLEAARLIEEALR